MPGAALPSKPSPEIFLRAAKKLEREPEQCVVIEDSLAGVKGGKNAGMKCIAVSTSFSPEALFEADRVVADYHRPLLPMLQGYRTAVTVFSFEYWIQKGAQMSAFIIYCQIGLASEGRQESDDSETGQGRSAW